MLLLPACAPGAAPEHVRPLATPTATPGVRVEIEERFYAVSGGSAGSLNRSLATLGPRAGSRRAHALTEWRLEWSYEPVASGSECESERPRVGVRIVTTLPRWSEVGRAPTPLVDDWGLFLARLRLHEAEHLEIAVRSGGELLDMLDGLVATDCTELRERAERAARRLEEGHRERQQRFDRDTRYGMVLERP